MPSIFHKFRLISYKFLIFFFALFFNLLISYYLCSMLRIILIVFLLAALSLKAASPFSSVKVQIADDFFAPLVLPLGDDRVRLSVNFDELGDDYRYLRYSITHLDPFGRPSSLLPSEYASGFNEARVDDYAFSRGVYRHYVNYNILFPSEDIAPLLSGRYRMNIFDEEDPDTPLLEADFAVQENIGSLTADLSHITDRGAAGEYQQLSFTFDPGNFEIRNPLTDITAIVVQNTDPASARVVTPLRLEGKKIIYEHKPELIFPAGNEFRRFETTRTDYTGMHIDSIRYQGDGYSTWLKTDYPRVDAPYQFDRTQHGRFKIDEYNASDPNLGADYIITNFTLDFPRVMNGDVFIDGEFTGHRYDDTTRMQYDEAVHLYRLAIPLKQGSYNYQYVLKAPGGAATPAPVEGNHYETQNQYTIYIYYTPPGARYARLLLTHVSD